MDWIALYLEEDLGQEGDVTSDTLFAPEQDGQAVMVARQDCVVAGLDHAIEVFSRLGADARPVAADGDEIEASRTVLLDILGPTDTTTTTKGEDGPALPWIGALAALAVVAWCLR